MLLNEILAKNTDLSEYDKKIMVNIHQAGEDGLNIKTLYKFEPNPANLRSSKEDLEDFGFIEETDVNDFYIITPAGIESLERASLIDDTGELNDIHASKYFYDDESNMDDAGL